MAGKEGKSSVIEHESQANVGERVSYPAIRKTIECDLTNEAEVDAHLVDILMNELVQIVIKELQLQPVNEIGNREPVLRKERSPQSVLHELRAVTTKKQTNRGPYIWGIN